METSSKLYSQIAAEAGVDEGDAQRAAYMRDLACAGKSLDDAAALPRISRWQARDIARDWGIVFRDYAAGEPMQIAWTKPERGHWQLHHDGRLLAEVRSDGHGAYDASCMVDSTTELKAVGSSAEIAARRISREIDEIATALFGVDDIEILFPAPDAPVVLAPKRHADPVRLQKALAA